MNPLMHFEARGEGPGLLVLGGWGLTTGPHLDKLDPAWVNHRRVLTCDYPGLGRSEPWATGFTTRDLADGVREALRHHGEQVSVIIGQGGLGAGVAMHLATPAALGPERLVLSAGWVGPEPYHDAQLRTMRTAREQSWEAFEELANVYCISPELFPTRPVENEVWNSPGSVKERGDAHLALIDANLSHDAESVVDAIVCPTLVVSGELDLLGGPRLARRVQTAIPNARLVEMKGHPHSRGVKPGAAQEYRECVGDFLNADLEALVAGGRS